MDKQTQVKIELLKRSIDEVKEIVQTETSSIYPQVVGFAQRINAHLNDTYKLIEELYEQTKNTNITETLKNKKVKDIAIVGSRNFEEGDIVICHNPLDLDGGLDMLLHITKISDNLVHVENLTHPKLHGTVYTKSFFFNEKNTDGKYVFEKVKEI